MADHGTFYWNELMTSDPGPCKAFFGAVLGWTSRDMDMGEGGTYTILKSNGTDIGGMFKMKGPQFEGVPPHWMGYIAVDDGNAAVAKVVGAGGAIRRARYRPNRGHHRPHRRRRLANGSGCAHQSAVR